MIVTGKRIALASAALIGFGVLGAAPASAQATRTWISGVGDDVNPCSRTAPCKTFQGAISKTANGGEINCLDPGGFGGVTITKSISLVCDNTQSGILVASTNAIIVNGAGAVVLISGMDIEGLGQTGSPGIHGINVINAAVVRVTNTKIRGFRNGYGINVAPGSAPVKVFVDNVTISEGGIGTNAFTGGIGFLPTGGFGIQASIRNTSVTNNLNAGIRIDTVSSGGSAINVSIENSQIDGNANGLFVKSTAGTGTARLMLTNSSVSHSTGYGIIANGTGFTGRVSGTSITDNATGVFAQGGATLSSYGTNQLGGNTADGAFSGTIPQN